MASKPRSRRNDCGDPRLHERDDPANPEGDNINLLYKYIVSTSLTFPEYVSPHARDLLRRILVPDPRKRADLFEVARHSWLAPFANIVGMITSSTTSEKDISNTTVGDGMSLKIFLKAVTIFLTWCCPRPGFRRPIAH